MATMIQERVKFERMMRERIEKQSEWVRRYSEFPMIEEGKVKVSERINRRY